MIAVITSTTIAITICIVATAASIVPTTTQQFIS